MRLVGTDGFRLSYCDMKHEIPKAFLSSGVCLSKKALQEIARICTENVESISLGFSKDEKILRVSIPGCQVFLLLASVKYPKYQSVLPKNLPQNTEISRSVIQRAVKRILLASDKTRALQLKFSSDSLMLSSKNLG